jgi:serine/threonine-protein phosphatase 2B catalytic subunit
MYDAIMASFDNLPLAATVNNSFFCVHGGLSPDLNSLREIHDLDRFSEVPREGPMCDLLWSDPYEDEADEERESENDEASQSAFFGYNETRQCSYVFGVEAVKQFLTDNKLTSIIRAHEAQVDGYKMHMVNKQSGIPRVITIFSAPNYCDVYKNKAACLKFDSNVLNIKQFIDSPHPYYLPNFMDVFQWSLPFVAEKVTDMLANILDFDDDDMEPEPPKIIVKAEAPKAKQIVDKTTEKKGEQAAVAIVVKAPESKPETKEDPLKVAIENLAKKNRQLREQNESVAALKQLTRNNTVPAGLMQESPKSIKDAIGSFEGALIYDEVNEHRPDQIRKKRGERYDPRRDSITTKASRAERLKEKRNSLPTTHLKEMIAPGLKNRRHVRNVKSEDLSRWAPATLAEPAFALTSADEPEDKAEHKTEKKK